MSAKVAKMIRKNTSEWARHPTDAHYKEQTFHFRYSLVGHATEVSDPITLNDNCGRAAVQREKKKFLDVKNAHPGKCNREALDIVGAMA